MVHFNVCSFEVVLKCKPHEIANTHSGKFTSENYNYFQVLCNTGYD